MLTFTGILCRYQSPLSHNEMNFSSRGKLTDQVYWSVSKLTLGYKLVTHMHWNSVSLHQPYQRLCIFFSAGKFMTEEHIWENLRKFCVLVSFREKKKRCFFSFEKLTSIDSRLKKNQHKVVKKAVWQAVFEKDRGINFKIFLTKVGFF